MLFQQAWWQAFFSTFSICDCGVSLGLGDGGLPRAILLASPEFGRGQVRAVGCSPARLCGRGRRSGRYSLRRLCFGLMKLAVRKNSFLVVDFMNFDNFLSNGRVRRWLGLARETIWLEPFNCIGPFLRSVCRSSVKSKLYVCVFPASLCDGNFWE